MSSDSDLEDLNRRVEARLKDHAKVLETKLERRVAEHKLQLESLLSQRFQAMEMRVTEIKQKLANSESNHSALQDELRESEAYTRQQQKRLVEAEVLIEQKLAKQARAVCRLRDSAKELSQRLSSAEVACQRVEAQGVDQDQSTTEVDCQCLNNEFQKDRERTAAEIAALQQMVLRRVEASESRLENLAEMQQGTADLIRQELRTGTREANHEDIKARLEKLESSCQNAENNIERLSSTVATSDTPDMVRQELDCLSSELRRVAREVNERIDGIVQQHRADLDSTNANHEDIKARLEELKSSCQDVKNNVGSLSSTVATSDTPDMVRPELECLSSELRNVNLRIDGIVQQRRADLNSTNANLEGIKSRLEASRTRFEELESGCPQSKFSIVEGKRERISMTQDEFLRMLNTEIGRVVQELPIEQIVTS